MAETPRVPLSYHGLEPTVKTFLSSSQLAKLLGVHPGTIRLWARAGNLKAVRVGPLGHLRFPASQLPGVGE
jgi:excisionase family DNA binding protein